jgi:hypothetical protein
MFVMPVCMFHAIFLQPLGALHHASAYPINLLAVNPRLALVIPEYSGVTIDNSL